MYNKFFQFQLNPFSQTPPSQSAFLSTKHQSALNLLIKEVDNQSSAVFLVLGTMGVGKSSLIKALIENFASKNGNEVIKHLNPNSRLQLSASDPIHTVMIMKLFSEACSLNADLQQSTVFILDNANNFTDYFLENLLSKVVERNKNKQPTLLILTGQAKLESRIQNFKTKKHSTQIIKSLLLEPLNTIEINDYINHRLFCANYSKDSLFTDEAIQYIAEISKGIPWLINTICSVSIFQASNNKYDSINKETVEIATEFCFLAKDYPEEKERVITKLRTPMPITCQPVTNLHDIYHKKPITYNDHFDKAS